ncbi:MAG: hypothetical protein K6B15_00295 [Parasporobacterium sp.]|nr:hypothetical protein [Parasporobacterium sp.]
MKKKGLAGSFAIVVLFLIVIIAVFSTDSEQDDNYEKSVGVISSYEQQHTIYDEYNDNSTTNSNIPDFPEVNPTNLEIPEYSGKKVETINGDVSFFTDEEKIYAGTYIYLSELDELGRCGVANSCVGLETRTTQKRAVISSKIVACEGWGVYWTGIEYH